MSTNLVSFSQLFPCRLGCVPWRAFFPPQDRLPDTVPAPPSLRECVWQALGLLPGQEDRVVAVGHSRPRLATTESSGEAPWYTYSNGGCEYLSI